MERQKKIVKTSIIGISLNILLVIFKTIVGILANSIAIVLDAVNNLSDIMSALITIVGVKLSSKAPDKKHPYGHGRIEYFSSLIIAVLILLAGLVSLKESVVKIIHPLEVNYSLSTIIVVIAAIFIKIFISTYYQKVGNEINSQSLIASGIDAMMDYFISISTLIGIAVFLIFGLNVDGILGVAISVMILKNANEIMQTTIDSIIGERADSELTKKLKKTINKYDEVQGVYDLSLHNYGPNKIMGSVHIQVRNNMRADEIHILTRDIEYAVLNKYGIILTIGIYAANDSGEYGKIKEELCSIIKSYKHVLQIHGFYVDKEKQEVYFDLIIDFDCNNKEDICDEIIKKIKEKYPKYNYKVIIDDDLTD